MTTPRSSHLRLLGDYLGPRRARVALLAVLLLGSIALQLANPQVVRHFIDLTQAGVGGAPLQLAAALFLLFGLGQQALRLATGFVAADLGWSATNALRADLTRHTLRLDLGFHKTHTPGELIARVDADVSALTRFFSAFVIHILSGGLLVVGILLLLLREDWRIGLVLGLYTVLTFFALGRIQDVAVARWTASRAARDDVFAFVEERLGGTEDLRAAGAEAHTLHRLLGLMRTLLVRERAAALVSNFTFLGTNTLSVVGYALGLGLGAFLYTRGDITIGAAFLIVLYIGMLSGPLETIREQIQDLQQATASIDRVDSVLRQSPRVRDIGRAALPAGPLGVAFDGVSFRYDDHTPAPDGLPDTAPVITAEADTESVLRDITFDLAPGETLGLLGRTGSGKTTLTRLLFRLYDPTAGEIHLGGVPLPSIPLDALRRRVSMVTQDVQLFGATVRDNLTLFNPRIPDAAVERVLRDVGLGPWLDGLPHGLATVLTAGGQGLSAGEAQLLAFARVFLRDPGLVLLDEASSRLDPATERLLDRAVDRLLAGRTGIIVAHRLQTVQRVDKILVLEHGRVVEFGPRADLARDPHSRFYRLLQTGEETLA